ncbi:hypothetical protein AMAG_14735 [Allomyces macrogynus ATCC 38327]|uniref:Mid2 domain-containing protein n=1 Tax=Allomyces macrogynus (strain ATCC 38327) TaxID=578462 RepID=A0A0L0T5P2_ALLM3|nr:hypothetical protein AMAG_14735 [Allomyces macrogynus ATCC 38327]|eukprot:KNE69889.1 hypothetical protein AMAG_14735 [Allomyces macrogynus ATCC 38327]
MALVGDTLLYLGGTRTNDAGTNVGSHLPLVSLLKIETANNGLQFRWMTDFRPASSPSSTKSGVGSSSNSGSDSSSSSSSSAASGKSGSDSGSVTTESSGLSTGAIFGIAIGAAVVGAVAVFGFLQYCRRQQFPDASKPVQPAPTAPAEPAQQYAHSQAYAQAQNTYAQPQNTYVQPQLTWMQPQPQPQEPQPTWAQPQQPQSTWPSSIPCPSHQRRPRPRCSRNRRRSCLRRALDTSWTPTRCSGRRVRSVGLALGTRRTSDVWEAWFWNAIV